MDEEGNVIPSEDIVDISSDPGYSVSSVSNVEARQAPEQPAVGTYTYIGQGDNDNAFYYEYSYEPRVPSKDIQS